VTYCVAMRLNAGLIFMSDTRTNAGVDNISKFRKMFTWEEPGERVITVLTAGNLATSQAVISVLDERAKAPKERRPSLLEAPTMFQVANIIGDTLKEVIKTQKMTGPGIGGRLWRHDDRGRPDHRHRAAPVHDLSGRQFYRGERGDTLFPDR
jgi:putative proteasome-type protease